MKPFLSGICLVYGNIPRAEEAIACFLNQDYDGPKELVVLNSAPQQVLQGEFPNVQIVNLKERPPSLGATRNAAIERANGEFILILDSDDEVLPGHWRKYAELIELHKNPHWVRVTPTFYAEKWVIKNLFNTWQNSVGFSKAAWKAIGGYSNALSVGEDRQFVGRLSKAFPGVTAQVKRDEVTAIYNWDTGTYHISGMGDDKAKQVPAYVRSQMDFEFKLRRRVEPKGLIPLHPRITHDPTVMAYNFLGQTRPSVERTSVALVYVGRFGDITNILPIAQHINNVYGKPYLVVGREFASLLDGVSYVKPYPLALKAEQLNEAMSIARKTFGYVIQCQIWGKDFSQPRLTDAYNKEAWRIAGFLDQFDNRDWKPVFDKRNRDEEAKLCGKLNPEHRPFLLTNVTKGMSSPFTQGPALLASIRERWGSQYLILDVGDIRATHIYDLMGVIDMATAVIAIDTSLLHLAAGCETPTLALVNSNPWQGTIPRFDHCVRMPYDKVGEGFSEFHAALETVLKMPKPQHRDGMPVVTAPVRKVFHVLERHQDSFPEMRRKESAVKSWKDLYDAGVLPVEYKEYKRSAKSIGDKRDLPYLKDVLKAGMDLAEDTDIIMFTNDDNVLHPEVHNVVKLHCAIWGACCSQRCEFKGPVPPMTARPEQINAAAGPHMGRDLFAFTKEWLVQKWDEIPDFILGASDWDLCMAAIIRLRWGIRTNRQNLDHSIWPGELPRGYVSHRFHPPKWNATGNRDSAPSQVWNRKLFRAWASTHLPELYFYPNGAI